MQTKSCLGLLASAALTANGALAADHRHAARHQQLHAKKNLVYQTTTTQTDVTWTTVYVDSNGNLVNGAEPTAAVEAVPVSVAASSSSSTTPVAASSSSSYVAPTTLVTSTSAAASVAVSSADPVVPNVAIAQASSSSTSATDIVSQVVSAVTSAAAAVTSAASSSSSSSTSGGLASKRGAAYNTASLVTDLLGSGSKIGWCYNWGQVSNGLSDSCAYVPMLWGNKDNFFETWSSNAQAAIDSGSKYLLSFNEPDNSGQANMAVSDAVSYHQEYMNPFSGKAKIGAPAVTNSNTAGESLDYLQSWIDGCAGNCDFDFCPVHWYNTIEAGADNLFEFATKASQTCGSDKKVWVTEYAPNVGSPSADQINSFVSTVQDAFDNNSTYDFVEAYAYFYVDDGLVDGTTLSTYGKTYAFS